VLSLFLPQWSIDRLRRRLRKNTDAPTPPPDERPIVLTDRIHNRQLVVACCKLARRAGVRNNVTLAHARVLLSGRAPVIAPLQPADDRRRLDALAQWALRYSPLVQVDECTSPGQGGLLIDIAGCERLFGGEQHLLEKVTADARRLGLHVRVAVADTIGCAWAMSRFGPSPLLLAEAGKNAEVLARLSVAALRLDQKTVDELATVGLRQVGQLLALSPAALAERFGTQVTLRIDQALGRVWQRVEPVVAMHVPRVQRVLGGPIRNAGAIQAGVRHLLDELAANLARGGQGMRRLEVTLVRSDAPAVTLAVPLSHPSCDANHVWTVLKPQLERANLGFGVEELRLAAVQTAPLNYAQLPLLAGVAPQHEQAGADRAAGELVDLLASRLGSQAVQVIAPLDSHVPEHSFVRREARETLHALASRKRRPGRSARGKKSPRPAPAGEVPDRPSVLMETPEPADVTVLAPEGPVVAVTWRGRRRAVRMCVGPERIAAVWWRGRSGPPRGAHPGKVPSPRAGDPASTRDYYKLQDDGGQWIWLYRRHRDDTWFVHGIWE
jgi:protein ImuB